MPTGFTRVPRWIRRTVSLIRRQRATAGSQFRSIELERVSEQRPVAAKAQGELVLADGLVLSQAQIVETDPESQEWTVRVLSGQDTGTFHVALFGSDGFKLVKVPKDMQSGS